MGHEGIIAEIEALDARRTQATLARNIDTLAALLSEDLRYVHSSGVDESRALYLERVAGGHYAYRGFEQLGRDFRVFGDVVLVNGDVLIDVDVAGTPKQIRARYLQAWARRGGQWQMVSWQSTPLPA